MSCLCDLVRRFFKPSSPVPRPTAATTNPLASRDVELTYANRRLSLQHQPSTFAEARARASMHQHQSRPSHSRGSVSVIEQEEEQYQQQEQLYRLQQQQQQQQQQQRMSLQQPFSPPPPPPPPPLQDRRSSFGTLAKPQHVPVDGTAGLFASSNYDEMHETLDRFFTLVEKPQDKEEKLQLALSKYRGKEMADFFDDLELHYGVPVRVFGTISLIRRYYRVYDPSMSADEINDNLTHSKGRENLLLEFCAEKYGVSVLDVCISTSQKLTKKQKEKREEAAARHVDPIATSSNNERRSSISVAMNGYSPSSNTLATHHSSSPPLTSPQFAVQSLAQQQQHQQYQQHSQQQQQQQQQQKRQQHMEVPSETPANVSNRRLSSYQNALLIQDAQNARRGSTSMRR